MKVYVLETAAYENRGVRGVFSSLHLAQASVGHKGDWTYWEEFRRWSATTGPHMDDCADITEYELDE